MLPSRFFAAFHRSFSGFPQHNKHLSATSLRVGIARWRSDVTRFSRRPRVAGQLPRANSQRPAKAYQLGNARTQAALRRTFEDLCKEDDISPVSAYSALQNCGRQLVDASPQARIALADQFISTLRSKGVKLDVSHYNALLSVFIDNGHNFSPLEFLTRLQTEGIQPSTQTYQLVLKGFCQQGNLQGAIEILEHIKSLNISLSEPLLAPLVTCNAKSGDMEKARAVFQLIRENGLEPGLESYTALLCAHAERGDMDSVSQVLVEMQSGRVFPTHGAYVRVLESLSKNGHSHLIPQLLEKIRNKQWMGTDLQGLVDSFVASGDFDGALHVLRSLVRMPGSSHRPGQDFYRKLIRKDPAPSLDYLLKVGQQLKTENLHRLAYEDLLYSRFLNRDKDGALIVINEMLTAGIPVRQHYFYPVLASLAEQNDLNGACQVLKLMIDHEITLEVPHFQYVVRAFLGDDKNRANLAQSLLDAFARHDIALGREINSLAQVCCDTNRLDAAAEILTSTDKEMILPQRFLRSTARSGELREGIPVANSSSMKIFKLVAELPETFNTLPYYASQFLLRNTSRLTKSLSPALSCLEAFFSMGVRIEDPRVYSALLKECVFRREMHPFSTILNLMKTHDVPLFPHHHKLTVTMGALEGRSQMAQQAFSKFTESQAADWRVYSDLMVAYGKRKNLPALTRVYEAMLREGFRPSGPAFGYAIVAYLSVGDIQSADRLKEDMEKTYKIGYAVYTSYIEAYSRKGDVAGARKMFDEMIAAEYTPSPFAYQKLIAAHAFHGDHETVLKLMEEMRSADMAVDRQAWSLLIDSYVNSGDVDSAVARAEEAKEKEIKPLLISYIKLLNLAVTKRRADLVEKIASDMKNVMNMNESDLLHVRFFAHVRAGDLEEAEKILQEPNFVGKNRSFSVFANSCARQGETEKILAAMELLKDMDVKLKYRLFAIPLLIAYGKKNDTDGALALLERIKADGVEPTSRFLALLASVLEEAGQDVPYVIPKEDKTAADDTENQD
ncbi:leucine-rich PPR motif-containing protein, mitochondrial-like [Oscarella lobularis]|uniref:leucine-rich PPR motif-containing protein, mitochondrial-like n=1 Tax=Oscarella lobularis TaxID=121494 RepID=UPI00331371B6